MYVTPILHLCGTHGELANFSFPTQIGRPCWNVLLCGFRNILSFPSQNGHACWNLLLFPTYIWCPDWNTLLPTINVVFAETSFSHQHGTYFQKLSSFSQLHGVRWFSLSSSIHGRLAETPHLALPTRAWFLKLYSPTISCRCMRVCLLKLSILPHLHAARSLKLVPFPTHICPYMVLWGKYSLMHKFWHFQGYKCHCI